MIYFSVIAAAEYAGISLRTLNRNAAKIGLTEIRIKQNHNHKTKIFYLRTEIEAAKREGKFKREYHKNH